MNMITPRPGSSMTLVWVWLVMCVTGVRLYGRLGRGLAAETYPKLTRTAFCLRLSCVTR
jgi:hypothetical protein